jgi:vacuolar protein 8
LMFSFPSLSRIASRYRATVLLHWAIFHPRVTLDMVLNKFGQRLTLAVGDYTIFIQNWTEPAGGIHGYIRRFLASGDPTFQHIAIWTLLQLLESEDERLIERIGQSNEVVQMVTEIADRNIESDDEDNEDGEGEVVTLARRCLELLGKSPKALVEG